MRSLKAHVQDGRIVADEPVDLPDGTRVVIVLAVEGDFDDQQRQEIDAALGEAEDEIEAGQVVSEAEVWQRLQRIG